MTLGDLRRKAELTGTVNGSAVVTMTVASQAEAQTEGAGLGAAEALTGGLAIDMHSWFQPCCLKIALFSQHKSWQSL